MNSPENPGLAPNRREWIAFLIWAIFAIGAAVCAQVLARYEPKVALSSPASPDRLGTIEVIGADARLQSIYQILMTVAVFAGLIGLGFWIVRQIRRIRGGARSV
jgi:hypothetical protein